MESVGFEPWTSTYGKISAPNQHAMVYYLTILCFRLYLKGIYGKFGTGLGLGLSPSPRFLCAPM